MRFPSVIICIFIAAFAGKTFMEVHRELPIVNNSQTIYDIPLYQLGFVQFTHPSLLNNGPLLMALALIVSICDGCTHSLRHLMIFRSR